MEAHAGPHAHFRTFATRNATTQPKKDTFRAICYSRTKEKGHREICISLWKRDGKRKDKSPPTVDQKDVGNYGIYGLLPKSLMD